MKGFWTLLVAACLALSISGCGEDPAKKPATPAPKPELGEPAKPSDMLPEPDKQTADAAKPADEPSPAKAAEPVVAADKALERAVKAVTEATGKPGQIDDTVDDVDEEE